MATKGGLFVPYFYFPFPVINELEDLIPFTPFEADFLVTANVAPPKSCPLCEVSSGPSRSYVIIWVSFPPSGYSYLLWGRDPPHPWLDNFVLSV